MNCVFHNKFKKWVPVSVVDLKSRCVNINDLLARANGVIPYSNNQVKPYSNNQVRPYSNNQVRPYAPKPHGERQYNNKYKK